MPPASSAFQTPYLRNPGSAIPQRVHVPNNQVLGFWVIVIVVQVLGKYMIIRYLDPKGSLNLQISVWYLRAHGQMAL